MDYGRWSAGKIRVIQSAGWLGLSALVIWRGTTYEPYNAELMLPLLCILSGLVFGLTGLLMVLP
jgi:hypothetical protein